MHLNAKAHDLNRRLFDLCYELSQLSMVARNTLDFDASCEFTDAVEAVKAAQTKLAATDLVIDASRDDKDQSYAVSGKSE